MIPVTYIPRPRLSFKASHSGIVLGLETRPVMSLSASKTVTIVQQGTNFSYVQGFVATTGFVILGTTHGIGQVKGVTILDDQEIEMLADTAIGQPSQDVRVNFGSNQTGKVIIY